VGKQGSKQAQSQNAFSKQYQKRLYQCNNDTTKGQAFNRDPRAHTTEQEKACRSACRSSHRQASQFMTWPLPCADPRASLRTTVRAPHQLLLLRLLHDAPSRPAQAQAENKA
jgi:hypothetical protein